MDSAKAVQPRRPIPVVRSLLVVAEVVAGLLAALLLTLTITLVVTGLRGQIPVTASLVTPSPLAQQGAAVDSGTIDLMLRDVALSVSWPYLVTLLATSLLMVVMIVFIAWLARGLRQGRPYRDGQTRLLLALAILWVVASLVGPLVLGQVQPAMAASAGVSVPGYTFDYVLPPGDLIAILVGPVLLLIAGAFIIGNRMWREHRVLV